MSAEWRSAREAALMAALKRHRDNIARLEERKAKYGLNVPLELENELTDERAMAMEVEAQLQHLRVGGADPLERLFREATRARLAGQVGRALQLYEQIQREDSTYPDIAMHVMSTKRELGRGYIDNGGRVVPERVKPRPTRMPKWSMAGALASVLCAMSVVIMGGYLTISPYLRPTPETIITTVIITEDVETIVVIEITRTPSPTLAVPTDTSVPTDTPTPAATDTSYPTYTPLPKDTPTRLPSRTPTLTMTPTHVAPTLIPAVDFKILKQDMRPLGSAQCETPEIQMYVLDKDGNPLDNILLEVSWEGGSKTFNSGWLGPGYEKATVSAGTFWVKVLGDVRPFGDRDYTSEVSRPLSTDQPTREDLEKAGYCQPGGECVECSLYSYEIVFQRQW